MPVIPSYRTKQQSFRILVFPTRHLPVHMFERKQFVAIGTTTVKIVSHTVSLNAFMVNVLSRHRVELTASRREGGESIFAYIRIRVAQQGSTRFQDPATPVVAFLAAGRLLLVQRRHLHLHHRRQKCALEHSLLSREPVALTGGPRTLNS